MTAILNDITQQYQNATQGWYSYLFPLANHVFASLSIIELAWSGIWWAVEKNDISSLWAEFLKKIVVIGFFYTLLLHAHEWVPAVIKSFLIAGSGAAGIKTLDPSSIFLQGVHLAHAIIEPLYDKNLLTSGLSLLMGYTTALVVIISYAIIAGELVVSLIESYLIVGAGILFLGFSSSRWTSQFSISYLRYSVSIGAKLFMLYLIIGVGANLSNAWTIELQRATATDFAIPLEVMGAALVFVFVAWSIPHKAESLLSGSVASSLSGLYAATSTVSAASRAAAAMSLKTTGAGLTTGVEAVKQASTVLKNTGSVEKAIFKTASNLASSTIGAATGKYRNVSQAMSHKTKQMKE